MGRMDDLQSRYQSKAAQVKSAGQPDFSIPPPRRANQWQHYKWLFICAAIIAGLIYGFFKFDRGRKLVMTQLGLNTNDSAPLSQNASPSSSAQATQSKTCISISQFMTTSAEEMAQLYSYMATSPHIIGNQMYNQVISKTRFFYETENDMLNAYSSKREIDGQTVPIIVMFGGTARFSRVAGLAVARGGEHFREMLLVLPEFLRRNGARMSQTNAVEAVELFKLVDGQMDAATIEKARAVSSGMIAAILAHEAGHLSLGHLDGDGSHGSLEVSRNREREADSFASSVLVTSSFAEYHFVGNFMWDFVLALMEGKNGMATDHPLSRERLLNLVRANENLARSLGVTEEFVVKLLDDFKALPPAAQGGTPTGGMNYSNL